MTGPRRLITLSVAVHGIGDADHHCRLGRTGGLVTRRTGKGFLPAPDSLSLPAPGHSCLPDASPRGCSKVPGGKKQSPGMPVPCPGFGALLCYPRSLAGKPLAGFRATPDRRIIVLCGIIVSVIRFKNPLLHRQSTLRKRRLGENRGFRPSF